MRLAEEKLHRGSSRQASGGSRTGPNGIRRRSRRAKKPSRKAVRQRDLPDQVALAKGGWVKRILNRAGQSMALMKKILIALVGGTVLVAGVAMIVLPGPAFLVIPAGLAILALEFGWARRWLTGLRKRWQALRAKKTSKQPRR